MSPGLLVGGMKCRGIKCPGLTVADEKSWNRHFLTLSHRCIKRWPPRIENVFLLKRYKNIKSKTSLTNTQT